MRKTVAIVGGGPAGMMAAIAAARRGARAVLFDGNEKLGKKLYITGKGRCNLTNACEREKLMKQFPRNPRFLLSCFSMMDNLKLMRFFEDEGVPLVVERGERVFPASGKASDITRALEHAMREAGVEIRLGYRCEGLIIQDGKLRGIRASAGDFACDAVIIATGGASYPMTGSTGDGYRFAAEAGHTIVAPAASLVPLETAEDWPRALPGLSLRNVELNAVVGKTKIFRERGEMLFTHFGVSGPLVLSMSAHLPENPADAKVWIDLKPALTPEQVNERVLREIANAQRKRISSVLDTLMPRSLADVFAGIAGVDPTLSANQITRAQRVAIADTLKRLPLGIRATRPVAEAVVTRGGVNVREVEPKTMRSKLAEGLYFAGEVLDVDGYTGGFNLTIAFSTGYAAGFYAAAEGEDKP